MPEQPSPKRAVSVSAIPPRAGVAPYAELHCKTNFSFLEGASHPDELVQRAAELGYTALAITDRHSLAGVVRAHAAAKEAGLKLLIGAEIRPLDAPACVLWATDREAYGRLARLLTVGRRRAVKGECELRFADIAEYARGLLCGVLLAECKAHDALSPFADVFGDRCSLLVELHQGADDRRQLDTWRDVSRKTGIPLAAANNVHLHAPERQTLQDVLTAVRHRCTVPEAAEAGLLFPNAERCLLPVERLVEKFATCPEAIARTKDIADRCQFSLDELRYEYPEELAPPGLTPLEYLTQLTWQGAAERYPAGLPPKVQQLIEHELRLIAELRYEAFFLTVWDLVRFARDRAILCQGRGSAANSVVCFCLGVTSVDPDRIDVLFERFVSKERDESPDIDVDFEHERREEVLQYVYEKYGRDRAGMTAEVICYRPRSAVRDVGKSLGLSLDAVDRLSKSLDHYGHLHQWETCCAEAGLDAKSTLTRRLFELTAELIDFPRHLSQHVGGMVISQRPLCELVPIENAAMEGRTVIQWDKDDLDTLGLLKVDCLCLGMLTAIRKAFDLLRGHQLWPGAESPDPNVVLAQVPAEDPKVYEMIGHADTIGVFQIESRAQMSMLPRLKPKKFYDLVIEVAIVRPGPIQGNMVHPYLRRRAGEEEVTYPNEKIRQVLHKTLGVPIFQEQAMKLVVVAAGFTPGEADQLRRAMCAWRKTGAIDTFKEKLITGMQANGYTTEFAESVFNQIRGFGEYGFPESHSASFAVLVYVSAWIKCYHPAVFACALLNSQPMGFYAPAQLVRDLREHKGEVRPVDVNCSRWDCTLEPGSDGPMALRLGFRMLKGFSEVDAERIVAAAPFHSLEDFAARTALTRSALLRLARGDAFASLKLDRRAGLWEALKEQEQQLRKPLTKRSRKADPRQMCLFGVDDTEARPALPELSVHEEVLADYRTVSLSLKGHPVSMIRDELDRRRVCRTADLKTINHGRYLRVAGVVLVRQRPGTAKGITFITLEDETGIANLIVRPEIMDRYRKAARTASVLIAHGSLEKHGEVIHVMVNRLESASDLLRPLPSQSRDFR